MARKRLERGKAGAGEEVAARPRLNRKGIRSGKGYLPNNLSIINQERHKSYIGITGLETGITGLKIIHVFVCVYVYIKI